MTHLLIMGDFNFKETDWNNKKTTVGENHPATLFMETVRDSFLFQHVDKHTRYRENMVSQLIYLPSLGSNCYIEVVKSYFKKYNFFKDYYASINECLYAIQWDEVMEGLNLSSL